MHTKDFQDYAWKWFEYYAGQRLAAFRFFLIALGIVLYAFHPNEIHGNSILLRCLAGLGAFLSIAFLALEVRNEQLVNIGRNALRQIENSAEFKDMPKEIKLLHIDKDICCFIRHKFWYRLFYGICFVGFLFILWKPEYLFSK
jgi:hypothetical protein